MPVSHVLPIPLEKSLDILEKLQDCRSEAVPLAAVSFKNYREFVHYRLKWSDVENVMEDVWTLSKNDNVKSWLEEHTPRCEILDWTAVWFPTLKARDRFFDELMATMKTA